MEQKEGKENRRWTQEEDDMLRKAVETYGLENWPKVAEQIPNRTHRQCYDRWKYFLDPNINTNPWTPEEVQQLIELHKIYGDKWAMIARQFKGRTYLQIKHKWTSLRRKEAALKETREQTKVYQRNLQLIQPTPQTTQQPVMPQFIEPIPQNSNFSYFMFSEKLAEASKDERFETPVDFRNISTLLNKH